MQPITLYTTETCHFCKGVKDLLATRGYRFTEVPLAMDDDGRSQLEMRTGRRSFPQLVVGDDTLGGIEEILAAVRTGKLAELVGADA